MLEHLRRLARYNAWANRPQTEVAPLPLDLIFYLRETGDPQ